MDRPRRRTVATLVAAGVLASSCAPAQGEDLRSDAEHRPVPVGDAAALPDAVDATSRLGTALLASGDASANVVLSPASIAVALAMLAEGAGGETAAALDDALGASGQARSDAYNALQAAVGEHDGDPAVVQEDELPERPVLHLANGIVIDEGREVEQDYLDAIARSFDAGMQRAELSDGSGKAVLDEWVNEHTGGLVPQSAVEPSEDHVLVLQNAVTLAARWASTFAPDDTRDEPFTTGTGEQVDVPTMHQTLDAAYTEAGDLQAVRLPYTEGFAMDVVLPPRGTAPAEVGAQEWSALDAELSAGTGTQVELSLPRVDVRSGTDLTEPLAANGLASLFEGAELSGIAEELALSQVAHQATLAVDEDGTVAAAVTEAVGVTSAPAPTESVEMVVDRPFALRIVHLDTGWPLFLGAINDPRS
ncbi:serpin family protein [Georgenia alba]|uniref:Serpin family protein n=1 Tax=Georgenia alba TaxID=2233858 RepID=A0ABW2QA49_9MICO